MKSIQLAVRPATGHPSEAFEFFTTKCIESFMARCVLHKSRLVAKSVIAVLPHAVEVGLVFPIVAAGKAAIFIKPGIRIGCTLFRKKGHWPSGS